MVRYPAVGKDVVDLANGEHVLARVLEHVEHRGARGLQREVMPARGAHVVWPVPRVGARDDAGDAVLAREDLARDAAVLVELLGGHHVLVRRNLEDAVARGVDNELASLELLAAVVLDHLRTGVWLVAENPTTRLALKLVQHLLGETVGIRGEALGRDDARHLPVPNRGVLAGRRLAKAGKRTGGRGDRLEVHVIGGLERAFNVEKAKRRHVGDVELTRGGAGAQGVAPLVTPLCGIWLGADAKAIQDDKKHALAHGRPLRRHLADAAA